MKRCAWKARVLPGMLEEYTKRHDNAWPELKQAMADQGIHNYSIWAVGDELFGYYELDDNPPGMADLSVSARWSEYMKDVMFYEENQPEIRQVFLFE